MSFSCTQCSKLKSGPRTTDGVCAECVEKRGQSPKTVKTEFTTVIWGERSADCYAGKNCDEKRPLWKMFAAGDMDHDETSDNLVFDCTQFPPGTKITIEEPMCPKCGEVFGNCMSRENSLSPCDFDWDAWTDSMYS